MFHYEAFGLSISSEIDLQPLRISQTQGNLPRDVTISYAEISEQGLADASTFGLYFQSKPDHLWLHVPNIARFEIIGGHTIKVCPVLDADIKSICLYVLGSCLGTILHQRNFLVMHANTIRFGESCVMFAGSSGSGKSSLAAAFHQHGLQVLTDDISAIDDKGRVMPSYPLLKLWHDTADVLDIDVVALQKIRPQIEKYAYVLDESEFCQNPLQLEALYFLDSHNQSEFLTERLTGYQTFRPIKQNTYRPKFIEGLGLQALQLQRASKLANTITVTRVTRPRKSFQLSKMVSLLYSDLQQLGIAA